MISPKLYIKVVTEGRNVKKLIDCKYHQCVESIQKKLIYLKPLNHGSMKTLLFFVLFNHTHQYEPSGYTYQARNNEVNYTQEQPTKLFVCSNPIRPHPSNKI